MENKFRYGSMSNNSIMNKMEKEIQDLKDKLHRRKMFVDNLRKEIRELKTEKRKTTTQLGYLTQHLLTIEEYRPDYLEDIKNNMI